MFLRSIPSPPTGLPTPAPAGLGGPWGARTGMRALRVNEPPSPPLAAIRPERENPQMAPDGTML